MTPDEPMADLHNAIGTLQEFTGTSLRSQLAYIEAALVGCSALECGERNKTFVAADRTMRAAATIKDIVGEINVIIHALGILLCLPQILDADERIEYVSLGAGNTGRPFDLETNKRIAEFKFIRWRGGPEAIRQNGLFKDFFNLAEAETSKKRYLYVLDKKRPLSFLQGKRTLSSVLNVHAVHQRFFYLVGENYTTVGQYYADRRESVEIVDVAPLVPQLAAIG